MRRSLQGKLILSYLAVALLTVLVVSALIRLTSSQSLMSLVVAQETARLKESVQTYYTNNETLDGFFEAYILNRSQDIPPSFGNPLPVGESPASVYPPPEDPNFHFERYELRAVYGLVDTQKRALMPIRGYAIGEIIPEAMLTDADPVEVDGQVVAYILQDSSFTFRLSPEEQLFLHRTTIAIGAAALAGMLSAVLMGYLLARGLVKPIRRLTQASQALASGNLEQQVPVTSQDELGQLTTTFNKMSVDLARADQQRKRMTADITHDLTTPLQIISGYIEMLEGGDVTLTPQRIEILKTEIEHLRRLVGDLTTLSQVEAGGIEFQLQPVQPARLLEQVYLSYEPITAKAGVELALDAPPALPDVLVDEMRMLQVLKNLVDNALRYTPQGGQIILSASTPDKVILSVHDTGSGIDREDLPYVFDRFYRADKARSVQGGKMGLGLAICKALVNAHGGKITAHSAGEGQGTTMLIALDPLDSSIAG